MAMSIQQLREFVEDTEFHDDNAIKTILEDYAKTITIAKQQNTESLKTVALLIQKMDAINSVYKENTAWEVAAPLNNKEVMYKLPLIGESISTIGVQLMAHLSCEQVLELVTPYVHHADMKDGKQILIFNDGTFATVSKNDKGVIDDLTWSQYTENENQYRIRFMSYDNID